MRKEGSEQERISEYTTTRKIPQPRREDYTVTDNRRKDNSTDHQQCSETTFKSAWDNNLRPSPEPWKNWWTCWTSLDISTPQLSPNSPLHPIEKMSGLFDKGGAGESRLSSASFDDGLDLLGLDNDLLSTLEKDTPLDLDVFSMAEDLNKDQGEGEKGLFDMEVFTDLSALLGGVPGDLDSGQMVSLDVNLLDEIINAVPAAESEPQKRTAEVAFGDASCATSNPDHDDYTAKRPRVATADSTAETEGEPAPSTSSFARPSSPTCATSETSSKYVQRRIKNNIASRRSRQTRKQKFLDMESQAEQLEEANEKLQQQVAELEKITKIMKDALVQRLAKGKSSAS